MELEALASRKFNRYHAYVRLHHELKDCTSLEQCADVSRQLIDNYLDNRMIWEELNWYKLHHTLLGKHPVQRKRQVEMNIWRVKSEMRKGDKPHLDVTRRERLAGYERELEDINRLLE